MLRKKYEISHVSVCLLLVSDQGYSQLSAPHKKTLFYNSSYNNGAFGTYPQVSPPTLSAAFFFF